MHQRAYYRVFAMCLVLQCWQSASGELPTEPASVEVWSPNHDVVAVSDPGQRITRVSKVAADGKRFEFWSTYGYFREFAISNDGKNIVVVNVSLSSNHGNEPMVWFIGKGEIIRVVSLRELIHKIAAIPRAEARYTWGHLGSVTQMGTIEILTFEGKKTFDISTGRQL